MLVATIYLCWDRKVEPTNIWNVSPLSGPGPRCPIVAISNQNSRSSRLPAATGFSFWIANNVPLKESERLNLLEIHSTLERLRIVWEEIQKLVERPSVICCSDCESVLSFTNDVFTVGGAEGSTSTYVNGGGYIHQITTLRSLVDENKVVFEGYPSTENR